MTAHEKKYPKEIHRSIYTSNPIESFNKKLKRNMRKKEQFPNEESLDRFTCAIANEYNKQFVTRRMRGFKQCAYEINYLMSGTYLKIEVTQDS